jgi:prolyl oligopeptidase PreP (S9A serine peptidase family)
MLFSCGPRAAFDTKVFDTDTKKTTEYPCAFQYETSKNTVVFRNTDTLYLFSKHDGTFLCSVTD